MTDPFASLPRNHFGAILADPPWHFTAYADSGNGRGAASKYQTMGFQSILDLPVGQLASRDCVLFCWAIWPLLPEAIEIIREWGFIYKTCGFNWSKANVSQIEMFRDDADPFVGMGYWTRSNTEPCFLATRGKPKRLNADVRQAIIEPRRQHSRKPDCVHERIERLVAGPYLELFARQSRPGWTTWGHERTKFDKSLAPGWENDDMAKSIAVGFDAVRERVAKGGPSWPKE